jgi:hypothetical protein
MHSQDCQIREYLGIDKEFSRNDTAYLFGENVKLRTMPTQDSESLGLLAIGTQVKILEKANHTFKYNGIDWPWYKIQYNDLTGYIVGGLIAMGQKRVGKLICLVSSEIENNRAYIITRVLTDTSKEFYENKSESLADNYGFCLKLFDNKGVEGIKNIVFINYIPESGGANSGGFYLFFDGKNLSKALDVASRGDIGFWEAENLIFPDEPNGKAGKIIYTKEKGEYDTNANWEKTTKIQAELVWNGSKLMPPPKTISDKIN